MNYAAHYERLVKRARSRSLVGYRERHHVVPKCMGGGNDVWNIVELTGEEHYVAHQLLVKMYPSVSGLALAAMRMARQCTGNKSYAWLRRLVAEAARERQTGKKLPPKSAQCRANLSRALKGNKNALGVRRPPISPEQSKKLSDMRKGKKRSPEAVAKTAAANRGKPCSPETRKKIGDANRGRKLPPITEETRAKLSAARIGKPHSPEHIEKISAANLGKRRSLEQRMKMSLAHIGKTLSLEHRAKLSGLKQSPETIAKKISST